MTAGLLADALAAESLNGADVLDLCTRSGFLAITAAKMKARTVPAVDISRRAVASAKVNVGLNRARVEVRHGHLFDALPDGARFDVIVANPPWVPAAADDLPSGGIERAWDAGRTGRTLLERICARAPTRAAAGRRLACRLWRRMRNVGYGQIADGPRPGRNGRCPQGATDDRAAAGGGENTCRAWVLGTGGGDLRAGRHARTAVLTRLIKLAAALLL
jgi:predicted methyltransferase